MPPRLGKSKKNTSFKMAGELRRSQAITTFGSGSIIDLPRLSGMIAGIDDWPIDQLPPSAKIHERNLELLLHKKFFYQVSSPDIPNGIPFGITAYRFPSWYYCPICHRLDHYKKIAKPFTSNSSNFNSELICNQCSQGKNKIRLIPSRFVVACLNGHIADFPYSWWVHKGEKCSNPKLKIEYSGATGGLDSIKIICETCGASASMEKCLDKDALRGLHCKGTMPWLGLEKNDNSNNYSWYKDKRTCNAALRVLQRSANNVYYPINQSALTIPPWCGKIQSAFDERDIILKDIFEEDEQSAINFLLKREYSKHADLYKVSEKDFIKEANIRYGNSKKEINLHTLRYDEYQAFCNEDVDDYDFKTASVSVPSLFKLYISKIKQIKKLREVMVLQEFRRILPVIDPDSAEDSNQGLFEEHFSPISKKPMDWLPAVELFGEGIFIELNESTVSQWELRVKDRYNVMAKRHSKTPWIGNDMFDANNPRYILLHTLSHLFIRQLAAQCGYATASIKEKIYSTLPGSENKMCGILIYTSATDTDGSLGGLVREGETNRIDATLRNILQEASWCSNDPICIDSKAQGFKSLNYAACHACALLPETSCESLNCLLDRASITGTPDNTDIAYFKELLS